MNYKQHKQCSVCGKVYVAKSANAKYCLDCRKNEYRIKQNETKKKREKEKAKAKKAENKNSLEQKEKMINDYNKLHGTHLSYGEYHALKRLGKLP